MSKAILVLMALALTACAASPPKPPKPNERQWVPINRSVPPELQKVPK
jgi:hypothetical protein